MSLDFLGDIESRFLANNLLTPEDWDISDFEGLDFGLGAEFTSTELLSELPEDLKFTLKDDELQDPQFRDTGLPEDMWMESSDSSDSGIHGVNVKTEPLSPVSSVESDFSCQESNRGDCFEVQSSPVNISPSIDLSGTCPYFNAQSTTVNPQHVTYLLNPAQIKGEKPTVPSIHSILNSQIRIRPKPAEDEIHNTLSLTTDGKKPLVLTADEFTRLKSQGLLQFPVKTDTEVKPAIRQTCSTILPNTLTSCHTNPPHHPDPNTKGMKRQQRMIKNRESASLSRRKKKEYVYTLEDRLKAFTTENYKLRVENETLKKKVDLLQTENLKLKVGEVSGPSPRTRTCLLAVVLMLTLNLTPWSSMLIGDSSRGSLPKVDVPHTGRHLMSAGERDTAQGWGENRLWDEEKFAQDNLMKRIHKLLEADGQVAMASNSTDRSSRGDCLTYPNSTESIRLAEKLAGWMWRHEQSRTSPHKKPAPAPRKKHLPLKKVKAATKGKYPTANYSKKDVLPYQVQVFNSDDIRREFFSAIHQRNDTFYVLSFSSDYFLMPATAYNKTTRPKMSLVMPALVNLNETMQPPEGSIGMMQIDCEVFDTRLIHVQKMAGSDFVRDRNSTRRGRR